MKVFAYGCLFICAAFCWSCSQEDAIVPANERPGDVGFVVADFVPEEGSRLGVDVNAAGAQFSWNNGDRIGTFSNDPHTGDLYFTVDAADGSNVAYFNGGGYALRANTQYCAYYPYDRTNGVDLHAIKVSFTGQAQNGNDNTAHLSKYIYLYCPFAHTNDEAGVVFALHHLCSLVRFRLTVPGIADLTKMRITFPSSKPLMTSGTYDLSENTPVLTAETKATQLDITLSNVATVAGDVVTVYAMLPPANYEGETLTVSLIGTHTYKGTVDGKNLLAGSCYGFAKELVAN